MSQFYDQASLVMIPSGVKDGKVYSQKPLSTDGQLTFSRGADIEATRINSQGLIQKAKVNLLLQSQTFENASWSVTNATKTANTAVAPDGTTTADTFAVTAAFGIIYQAPTISSGSVCTYSVYVKNIDAAVFTLQVRTTVTAGLASFNFTGGTLTSSSLTSGITQGYTDEGNGWYRVFVTFVTSETNQLCRFQIQDSGDSVYLWGAQLNYGLVAQTYVPTTTAAVVTGITNDMPRLNYDPANPTCPSLLLEPSRTNLVTHSEYIADSSYTKTNATVSTNTAIAPDGTLSASTITSTATNGFIQGVATVTSGVVYTMSVWLKRKTGTGGVQLRGVSNTSTTVTITNEWARYSVTLTAADVYGRHGVLLNTSGDEVYAWGFQLEAGSYPTSYIPTYGTSATRTADACSKTGISSLIGQTEGTIFIELGEMNTAAKDDVWIELSDGTTNNRILIYNDSSGNIRNQIKAAGTISSLIDSGVTLASNQKIAITYKTNEAKIFINGVQRGGTDTSVVVPAVGNLYLSNFTGTIAQSRNIKQGLIFKTVLSDTELATLTA